MPRAALKPFFWRSRRTIGRLETLSMPRIRCSDTVSERSANSASISRKRAGAVLCVAVDQPEVAERQEIDRASTPSRRTAPCRPACAPWRPAIPAAWSDRQRNAAARRCRRSGRNPRRPRRPAAGPQMPVRGKARTLSSRTRSRIVDRRPARQRQEKLASGIAALRAGAPLLRSFGGAAAGAPCSRARRAPARSRREGCRAETPRTFSLLRG